MSDTIIAQATPHGKSGVAIIRVSGCNALQAVAYLGVTHDLEPRYAYYKKLFHPQTTVLIDECLLLYFKAPHSFTGEDIVEFHCHGSIAIANEVISLLLDSKLCRYAEAGEFTRRALYNDKLSLLQAEGLNDIINAQTKAQKKLAMQCYGNEVEDYFKTLQQSLIEARAFCEVFIDFPDDDLPDNMIDQIDEKILLVSQLIKDTLSNYDNARQCYEGINVVIIGIPNAGKSSLINAIANDTIAIVTDIAGTTRDAIGYQCELNGVQLNITDTAGFRDTNDIIEREGIKRAKHLLDSADVVIKLIDSTKNVDNQLEILPNVSCETITVYNKCDLNKLEQLDNTIYISVTSYNSIKPLIDWMYNYIDNLSLQNNLIYKVRHKQHLESAQHIIDKALYITDLVIKAELLQNATNELSHIYGSTNIESILDMLFKGFCIGK